MRSYNATSRRAAAEQTRDRVCTAAEELFLRDGYAKTSMRAVARAAGVAEATLYLAFGTKAALLDAVIIRATRGSMAFDDIAGLAAAQAALMERAARILALGEAAALMDADLRPLRDAAHERLRAFFHSLAARLGQPDAGDTLYALLGESTYLRLG